MIRFFRLRYRLLFALALSAVCGCLGPSGKPAQEQVPESASAAPKKFVLGDLVEPFDPPGWEELEKVEWIDQPVIDSLELLREHQKKEKPLATVEEALALRNTSPEANEKILCGLGRLPASDRDVNWDASMSRYSPADANTTNPVMISTTADFDISGFTAFGLFSFDWEFRPFAAKDTVVSWQTSKDRMMDKVVLRDDLVWSDGEPITAHDVVFSFKVIMTDAVPVPAVRSGTDKIRWIKAYGDHTLVYFHKEALATNIWNLNFSVIPRHIYENSVAEDPTFQHSPYHVKYENEPVVGGPYQIVSRTRGKEIVLRSRKDWYMRQGKQVRDRPYFKEIRFKVIGDPTVALLALKKGEIEEMLFTSPSQWVTQTNDDDFYARNTKVYGVEWTTFHFGWNLDTAFFRDVRVRKAMSYAVDYDELLGKLLYGLYERGTGVFHPSARWYPKEPMPLYDHDLDKSEELLDAAGWRDHDGDGVRDKEINGQSVRFEFSILCNNDPLRIAICNLLKEELDRIGIICHVRPLEATVLFDKTQRKEFQAYFGGWGTGADPDTSENIWATGQDRNFVSYSNPEVDRLFAEGRKEFDPDKRAEIYRRIHKLIYEDQPYTWLYTRNSFYGFNKSLRGYMFSPRGPYHYGPGFSSIWKPAAMN